MTLNTKSVTLPTVPLAAGQSSTAVVNLPPGIGDPLTSVSLSAVLKDGSGKVLISNGGTCAQGGPDNPV